MALVSVHVLVQQKNHFYTVRSQDISSVTHTDPPGSANNRAVNVYYRGHEKPVVYPFDSASDSLAFYNAIIQAMQSE